MADSDKACNTCNMKIVIIGGGKMGQAILGGWIDSPCDLASSLHAENFIVVEPSEERRSFLNERYGVTCIADARDISSDAAPDIVVLAVKPQVMADLLQSISGLDAYCGQDAPLFISIAAGLTTDRLLDMLDPQTPLVRVMPNTPLMVGAGATAVCASRTSTQADVELVRDLFACLGNAHVVDEADMDAVCALSGSGPAYVAAMVEALRDAGVSCGLDAELAESLAQDTVYGTCLLMRETGQSPETTRESVCSPGGTTLAALDAMNEAGFADVFARGVEAAVKRSKELASC